MVKKNFLTGRTFQTKVDNTLSDIADLSSGIVQGSGIGPVMFLMYINELITMLANVGVKVKAFADDVKVYIKIVNDVDCNHFHFSFY